MYLSINIFDRYLATLGFWNLKPFELDYLICISCFTASKIEELQIPELSNIIYKYQELTGKGLQKDQLLSMERQVIVKLQFGLNSINPEFFIDRYIYILGYQNQNAVRKNAVQILTLHYIDEKLLNYPLSKVAASSVILAIYFYNLEDDLLPNNQESYKLFHINGAESNDTLISKNQQPNNNQEILKNDGPNPL